MSHALTFSRAAMALGALGDPPTGCLYGFRSEVPRFDTSGRAAQVGSLVHKLAETHLTGESFSMDDVDQTLAAEALALFGGPLRAWLEDWRGAHVEAGLLYDAENDTASVGPRRGEDGYEVVGPMHVRGTLDLARIEAGIAYVVDIKSGQKANAHHEQLYMQAVAFSRLPVARTMGVKEVRVAFAFARRQRMPEVEYETLDADRLDHEAGRIRKALRLLPTAEPQRGDWCHRCPARAACPAWEAQVA